MVLALKSLKREEWLLNKCKMPSFAMPNAIKRTIQKKCGPLVTRLWYDPCEAVLRFFSCIIIGDRSGKLTTELVENGILDFILNTMRTNTDFENSELAMVNLSLMYTRSRITCALVSRYIPPPVAKAVALARGVKEDVTDVAYGLYAAAAASYVLYPGAHSMTLPSHRVTLGGISEIITTDFEQVSKHRPGDFQCALLRPSYCSLLASNFMLKDGFDKVPKKEFEVDKTRYNIDHLMLASTVARGVVMDVGLDPQYDMNGELVPTDDEEASEMAILNIYETIVQEQSQYEALKDEEEFKELGIDDESDIAAIEKAVNLSLETKSPSYVDPQRALLKEKPQRLVDRYSAADQEWLLIAVFPGTESESVLHRGLLRITLSLDSSPGENNLAMKGFWTVDAEETMEAIKENSLFETGQYGYGEANQSSEEDSSSQDHTATKESWKQNHIFNPEGGGYLDISGDAVRFEVRRKSGDLWVFDGSGNMNGFAGGIYKTKVDDEDNEHEEDDEEDDDDEEEEKVLIGGFLLLKPEHPHPSVPFGKEDLNAYERLAHVPLKVGPLVDPTFAAFPSEWNEDPVMDGDGDGDGDGEEGGAITLEAEFSALSQLCCTVTTASTNSEALTAVVEDQLWNSHSELEIFIDVLRDLLLVGDEENEEVYYWNGNFAMIGWRHRRFEFGARALSDLLTIRTSIVNHCKNEEVDEDIRTLRDVAEANLAHNAPIKSPSPDYIFSCFTVAQNPLMDYLDKDKLARIDELTWQNALLTHYKWASRLQLFEVAGLCDFRALRYTYLLLANIVTFCRPLN